MYKLKVKVSNRLPVPFDKVEMVMVIKAETREMAIDAASEFGKKHGALLTY